MIRPLQTWIAFGLCLAIAFAAVGWISKTALELDRQTVRRDSLEENVRLALWRMETALTPIITQESSRPYFAYSAFYAAERAYTRMYAAIEPGEVLMPSPLLATVPPYILLHFQLSPDGKLSSPQVPIGNMRDVSETVAYNSDEIKAFADRLAKLQGLISRDSILNLLPEQPSEPSIPAFLESRIQRAKGQQIPDTQYIRNTIEWTARRYNQDLSQSNITSVSFSPSVREGSMHPLYLDPLLLLARRVSVNGQEYVQGCWLDWPQVKQWLTESVKDLLPGADLLPAVAGNGYERGRLLAALPIRLLSGPLPADQANRPSRARLWLLIAWGGALVAVLAVAALLRGVLSLSERRGAFVSAVTHELRTPLTTLRMYTEMLAEGIVSDKQKVERYIDTLRSEADRLGYLVENVLGYARLEANRGGIRLETLSVEKLLDRMKNRLSQRAERAGMRLLVESEPDALSARARADTSAVEHILFNLVDNACKYAAGNSDNSIHIEIGKEKNLIFLRVRDRGPGIDPRDAKRLFRPFRKSARDAANSMPGVGLGLALSRRLARRMGGDLILCRDAIPGACFLLTLPADGSGHQPSS